MWELGLTLSTSRWGGAGGWVCLLVLFSLLCHARTHACAHHAIFPSHLNPLEVAPCPPPLPLPPYGTMPPPTPHRQASGHPSVLLGLIHSGAVADLLLWLLLRLYSHLLASGLYAQVGCSCQACMHR